MGGEHKTPDITGSDTFFSNIDDAFTATKWEACIEQAIDKINGYIGEDIIPAMTGSAGSKTVSVTSMEAGFIRDIAAALYIKTKTSGASSSSISVGGLSTSTSISTGSTISQADDLAKEAAQRLKEIEVSYG